METTSAVAGPAGRWFTTTSVAPSGVRAHAMGSRITGIDVRVFPFAASSTSTRFANRSHTYRRAPSLESTGATGECPAGASQTSRPRARSMHQARPRPTAPTAKRREPSGVIAIPAAGRLVLISRDTEPAAGSTSRIRAADSVDTQIRLPSGSARTGPGERGAADPVPAPSIVPASTATRIDHDRIMLSPRLASVPCRTSADHTQGAGSCATPEVGSPAARAPAPRASADHDIDKTLTSGSPVRPRRKGRRGRRTPAAAGREASCILRGSACAMAWRRRVIPEQCQEQDIHTSSPCVGLQ